MSIPPSLIGVPVAFLPVPLPQTDFVADAVPEPTVVVRSVGSCADGRRRQQHCDQAADCARHTDFDLRRSHQFTPLSSLAS